MLMEWLFVKIGFCTWELWRSEVVGDFKSQHLIKENVYLAPTLRRGTKGY